MKHERLLTIFMSLIILLNIGLAVQTSVHSKKAQVYKTDYSNYNSILFGLFSIDHWKKRAEEIVLKKIDDFSLSTDNKAVLRKQVNVLLHSLLDELEQKMEEQKQKKGVKAFFKEKLMNICLDVDEFRAEVPRYSNALVEELSKEESGERLKLLIKSKVSGYLNGIRGNMEDSALMALEKKYELGPEDDFNSIIQARALIHGQTVKRNAAILILSTLLLFLLQPVVKKYKRAYKGYLLFLVISLVVVLLVGITSPMIELDARLSNFSFYLLGELIRFDNQVIYFQSKSIIDVVVVLVEDKNFQNVFVGFLIIAFSVILPASKLISSYFLVKKPSWQQKKFITGLAFHTGKWSMADVFVVAIFMAYVGFQGIIDKQLEQVQMQSQSLSIFTTNQTSFQPGYLVFIFYCLGSLVLAHWIKKYLEERGPVGPPPVSVR